MEAAMQNALERFEEKAKAQLTLVQEPYRDDEDEAVREDGPWEPSDLNSVDWALKRIGALEKEISDNEEMASRRIQEIHERLGRLNEKAMRGVEFFRKRLEAYAISNRDALLGGGKKKSRGFIHGTVGFRKKPGLLKTVDRAALMAWVRELPVEMELVRMKEEPDLDRIKKHAEEKQLVPPGMQWEPEVEEIQIRADLKEVR
jgi:phage host-nuclease inhibitor protein Gam